MNTLPALASHTPGPWLPVLLATNHQGYEWPTFTVRSGRNVCLAVVGDIDSSTAEQNAANARLIAAAPDLLAALEKCVNHVGHYAAMAHASSDAHKDFAQARAAIAKAIASHES